METTFKEVSDASEALLATIEFYNADLEKAEANEDKIELLEAKLEQSYVEQCKLEARLGSVAVLEEKLKRVEISKEVVKQLNDDLSGELLSAHNRLDEYEKLLKLATENAHKQLKIKDDLDFSEDTVKALRKEIKELRGPDSPKRLREQNKRQAAANIKSQTRLALAENANKEYQRNETIMDRLLEEKDKMIKMLKRTLDDQTGGYIYNSGEHFLLKWEDNTEMETIDKKFYTVKTILYFHECGRAALMSIDPISGNASICRSPRGGIRPNKETLQKAQEYLTQ